MYSNDMKSLQKTCNKIVRNTVAYNNVICLQRFKYNITLRNACSCFSTPLISLSKLLSTIHVFRRNSFSKTFSTFFQHDIQQQNLWTPIWDPAGQICQVESKGGTVHKPVTLWRCPRTDPFPESNPIDLFYDFKKIYDRCISDLVSLVCSFG